MARANTNQVLPQVLEQSFPLDTQVPFLGVADVLPSGQTVHQEDGSTIWTQEDGSTEVTTEE